MFKALNHVIIEKADVKQALSIRLIFNKRDLHMFKGLFFFFLKLSQSDSSQIRLISLSLRSDQISQLWASS